MLRTVARDCAAVGHRPDKHAWGRSWHHGSLTRLGGAAVRTIWVWMDRSRQRRALAELDDHLLRDIGLTRNEVRRECANPFWMP